jgi:transcriptional regulator with XRE-family HTH domain
MDLVKDMGRRLCMMRNFKGYHIKKVARFVGVSETLICRMECGNYMPPWSVYEDVMRVLGIDASEFMSVYRWTYAEPVETKGENEDEQKVA